MTRQRRIQLRLVALETLAGAIGGYAAGGIGLAVAGALMFVLLGLAIFRLSPQLAPPSPRIVPRPATGDTPQAVRRRHTEAFAVAFVGLPLVVACALLGVAFPWGPAAWAAIALSVVFAGSSAIAFVLVGLGGARMDGIRQRQYERTVTRLSADRELYEQTVDPAAEAAKTKRLVRWFHVVLVAQGAVALLFVIVALIAALL